MVTLRCLLILALCSAPAVGCGGSHISVNYRPGYSFTDAERGTIATEADRTVRTAREVLPGLPETLTLTVLPGKDVIPETGESATIALPDQIYWTFDPDHPGGLLALAQEQLGSTLLHELYHLVPRAAGEHRARPVDAPPSRRQTVDRVQGRHLPGRSRRAQVGPIGSRTRDAAHRPDSRVGAAVKWISNGPYAARSSAAIR